MSSLDTKLLIAHSFITLVEAGDYRKVSVSDIVAASKKNRKTFYYHFPDRSKLVTWIFRYDLAQCLKRIVPEDGLVYNKRDPKELAGFPYYTFIKDGVRSIDGAPFFLSLDACFTARQAYYAQVLSDTTAEGLPAYMRELYTPALRHDIEFILSNRFLNERNQQFLAEFYTGAFITYFSTRVLGHDVPALASVAGPFQNLIHDSIAGEISRQQQERML